MATQKETAPAAPVAPIASGQNDMFGIIAMILGILSLVLSWFWYISLPLGIIAIILAIMSMNRAKKTGGSKGMAIAGLVCGILGSLSALIIMILVLTVFSIFTNSLNILNQTINPLETYFR